MPKVHFCKRVEEGIICGQTDPEKFEVGRYSICKDCRRKETYISIKKKKVDDKEIKIEKIFSGVDLSEIAKDTFLKIPINNGETMGQNLESLTRSIDKFKIEYNENNNIINMNLSLFQKSQNDFRKKYDDLHKKYDDLKEKYDKLEKYCFDIKTYVYQLTQTNTSPFKPKDILE